MPWYMNTVRFLLYNFEMDFEGSHNHDGSIYVREFGVGRCGNKTLIIRGWYWGWRDPKYASW